MDILRTKGLLAAPQDNWNQAHPVIAASIFILLNVADAWLTTQLLAHEGAEAFWWSSHFNGNMLVKGLLAFLVAILLIRLDKAGLLKWLNIAMLFVVLSNGICFLGYLGSWLYFQTQIATYP
jgi:hypothetical protein